MGNLSSHGALQRLLTSEWDGLIVALHLQNATHELNSAFIFDNRVHATDVRLIGEPGATVSSSVGAARVMTVGKGAPLVMMRRLTLVAPLLVAGGELVLDACHFTGCAADSGGAILQTEGVITATDCTFVANQAEDGGAVLVSGGHAEFMDCRFERNQADRLGGAIFLNGLRAQIRIGAPETCTLCESQPYAIESRLHSTAVVTLSDKTLLESNVALSDKTLLEEGNAAHEGSASVWLATGIFTYRLPAPKGRWILVDAGCGSLVGEATPLAAGGGLSSDYPCKSGLEQDSSSLCELQWGGAG